MKLAGVVIFYNPTKEDISRINNYVDSLDQLYIIDNSKIMHDVSIKSSKIKYIWNKENLGIAEPLNMAAKLAINNGYKYLLTLDQDSEMNSIILKEMRNKISCFEMQNIGIVTPWHSTKLNETKPTNTVDYPLQVMMSGNIINLEIYSKIGGYKDWLFIDGVDIDYCLNLKKNNYKIMRLNNIELKHNLGNIKIKKFLGRKFICTNHNYIRNYYMARNYRYIKDEYKRIANDYCNTLIKYKSIIFKIIVFEPDKYRKIRNIFRGIYDYNKRITGKYPYNN